MIIGVAMVNANKPMLWGRLLVLVLGLQLLAACDSLGLDMDDQQLVVRAKEYLSENAAYNVSF